MRQLTASRAEVDRLTASQDQQSHLTPALAKQAEQAGLSAVIGPGVTVTLADAPDTVAAAGSMRTSSSSTNKTSKRWSTRSGAAVPKR